MEESQFLGWELEQLSRTAENSQGSELARETLVWVNGLMGQLI